MPVETYGQMTVASADTESLPHRGAQMQNPTNVFDPTLMQARHLGADLELREASMQDGFEVGEDYTRGAYSSARTQANDLRTADEIKDELMAMGGETPEQRMYRKAGL